MQGIVQNGAGFSILLDNGDWDIDLPPEEGFADKTPQEHRCLFQSLQQMTLWFPELRC